MTLRTALLNDAEEAIRLALDGRQSRIWSAIPAIVAGVDFTKMTVSAQPAIQGTVEQGDGTKVNVNLPLLVDVPLVFPSGGGFAVTLPVAVGDEVLVIFSARCIDAWWQSGGIQRPMEARMHDLSDGFAIPGPRSLPKVIPSISATSIQIRNLSGDAFLEIDEDGKINIVSPAEVNVTAPSINLTGAVLIDGTLDVTGAATFEDTLDVAGLLTGTGGLAISGGSGSSFTGDVSGTGSITAATIATLGGIDLGSHRHTGVSAGPDLTGGPVP